MVYIKTMALHVMPVNIVWFAAKPQKWRCLKSYYKQSTYCGAIAGYRREPFFTKVIDISAPQEVFEAAFEKNTIYEIKRALRDGVTTAPEHSLTCFINFYNLFASSKQLPKLSANFYNYQSNIVITKAIYNNQAVVMHAYITDMQLKRVRLLYSASLYRNETDTQLRAVTGRANRLLHFNDMCFFKQQGFQIYDLGGYALGTNNQALLRINDFKDSFGGKLLEESDYVPIPALVFSFFNKMFKA